MIEWAKRISAFRENDEAVPKPSSIRQELKDFRKAVDNVRGGLDSPTLLAFLGHYGEAAGMRAGVVDAMLADLANQADTALGRLSIKPGQREAYPVDPSLSLSGKQLTAWVVREAIQNCKEARPGIRNSDAINAANALWQLAGGAQIGEEGWSEHFKDVRGLEATPGRVGDWLKSWKLGFAAQPGPVC